MGVVIKKRGTSAPDFTIDEINAKFRAQLSDQGANIVNKLPKPREVVLGKRAGVYFAGAQRLESGIEREIITHEYGHHVDHIIRKTDGGGKGFFWSVSGLKDEWAKDRAALGVYRKSAAEKRRRLRELRDELCETRQVTKTLSTGREYTVTQKTFKFDGATMLSDIIDSFVGGSFRTDYEMYGHSKSYWKDKNNGPIESFANMFAIQNQPEARAWAQKNIPNMWAKFTAKMNELEND